MYNKLTIFLKLSTFNFQLSTLFAIFATLNYYNYEKSTLFFDDALCCDDGTGTDETLGRLPCEV
jgi:hypothetical protein